MGARQWRRDVGLWNIDDVLAAGGRLAGRLGRWSIDTTWVVCNAWRQTVVGRCHAGVDVSRPPTPLLDIIAALMQPSWLPMYRSGVLTGDFCRASHVKGVRVARYYVLWCGVSARPSQGSVVYQNGRTYYHATNASARYNKW